MATQRNVSVAAEAEKLYETVTLSKLREGDELLSLIAAKTNASSASSFLTLVKQRCDQFDHLLAGFLGGGPMGKGSIQQIDEILKDNILGMAIRVGTGAVMSTLDGATDIFVISEFYKSDALVSQANALLAMVSLSMLAQLVTTLGQYKSKGLLRRVTEVLITILFLRPAADAYRVATNHADDENTVDAARTSRFFMAISRMTTG